MDFLTAIYPRSDAETAKIVGVIARRGDAITGMKLYLNRAQKIEGQILY
jgi:hypothetical protein